MSLQVAGAVPSGAMTLAQQQLTAGDRMRTAVFYGIDWGYSDSAPYQVAQAVWWVRDGSWQSADHATAERIATAAVNAPGIPSWNPDGRSLLTVISQGQAAASSLTLTPLQQSSPVGNGTLEIRNNSASDIVVYLPYGTLFTGPTGSVLVWATGVGTAPGPASPTAQSAATTEPTATALPPTSTPVPVQPVATQVQQKGGTPPPAESTPTERGQSKRATATPIVPPATDTPAPQPTATAQPTNTSLPTDTPLPVDTQTPLPQPTASNQQAAPQPPSSAPNQPVQQKGQPPQVVAPAAPGLTEPSSGTSKASEAPVSQPDQQPAEQPVRTVEGPLPFTPAASISVTATASATTATNRQSDAVPPPVGTSAAGAASAPRPVGTAGSQAVPPQPVGTLYPTALAGTVSTAPTSAAGKPPVAVSTFDAPVPPTAISPPSGVATGSDVKPTPVPQPAPVPQDAQPKPQPPVIDPPPIVVGPAGDKQGTDASGSGVNGAATGGVPSAPVGSPPTNNPVTGAGPSSMPVWLAIASMLMLLGGWQLRRVSRVAHGATGKE